MPRKGHVERREVLPDPVYNSKKVSKLINKVMWDGKKSLAQKICYGAFDIIREKTGRDPLEVFEEALNNVIILSGELKNDFTLKLFFDKQNGNGAKQYLIVYKSMMEKLAAEIMDAANNTGGSVKKKEDTHKMAEANKAFAHYRW